MDYKELDWIVERYEGILDIYPTKCMNSFVLSGILTKLQETHDLVQLTRGWIRAFRKE